MNQRPGLPTDAPGFEPLAELAVYMRWSWNDAPNTVRVIPHSAAVAVPLKEARLRWL